MTRFEEQAPERRSARVVRCGAAAGLQQLRANTAVSLHPRACGLALRCLSGLVVVTQEGDAKDHELHPGDEFLTAGRGRVVAWALSSSVFSVTPRAAEEAPRKAA